MWTIYLTHALFGHVLCSALERDGSCSSLDVAGNGSCSALELARLLKAPEVTMTRNGEFEGGEFWEDHDAILSHAWSEAPRRYLDLYSFDQSFESAYITEELRKAAVAARQGEGEVKLRSLFQPAPGIEGVWVSDKLFTANFTEHMLEELDHLQSLGIPLRRPNGMNRYGMILDDVGFEHMLRGLVNKFIRPLAEMLFPDVVGAGDAQEHYAFSIRYAENEDVELAKHRDQATATLNLCLGRNFEGGDLKFFGNGASIGNGLVHGVSSTFDVETQDTVRFRTGLAVFHRGQHQHEALPLVEGVRTNIIIWMFAEHGFVRVAPYSMEERLSVEQRWHG